MSKHAYIDAMLDAVDSRDRFVKSRVDTLLSAVQPIVEAVVAAASRPGRTDARVQAEIKRQRPDRVQALWLLETADLADGLAETLVSARIAAVLAGAGRKVPRIGPITRAQVESRRQARGDDKGKLRVGGRLPPIETLRTRTDAELNLLLRRFGLEVDRQARFTEILLDRTRRLSGGFVPDDALVERIVRETEGQIRREMLATAKDVLRQSENGKLATSGKDLFRWQSVMDDRVCESCNTRHDRVQSWAAWQSEGPPGNAATLCGPQCRCSLEPDEFFESPTPSEVSDLVAD